MKVTMIDPPMGWKFGFPKVLPEGVEVSHAWFVEQGYPQEVIDAHGKYFCWRTWEEEIEDESLL